ncbi:putative membrane protein YczE [Lentzea atacamensis]|uniref:Membrane protein YczE n=1 Tax=Lentzea atacamensis TaxID=531938 RepID=A0ABX9DVX5_9PSEU|nr:hypothetical protein [Lentzea atacamensis]RAS59445.1 putative membrane protein YczE [Lentzea atacamensis]
MTLRALRPLLPMPVRFARVTQMIDGTVLMGAGIALLVHARLGLLPLDVFHSAVARHTGWTIGGAFVATQMVFLVLYVPLGIRWGAGTITAALVPALVCDVLATKLPPVEHLLVRAGFLLIGAAAFALGAAAYLGAGLGALPRDGVMAEIARRRRTSLAPVRVTFDVASLLLGVGAIGPATAVQLGVLGPASVVLALLLGPSISHLLPYFTRSAPEPEPRLA